MFLKHQNYRDIIGIGIYEYFWVKFSPESNGSMSSRSPHVTLNNLFPVGILYCDKFQDAIQFHLKFEAASYGSV